MSELAVRLDSGPASSLLGVLAEGLLEKLEDLTDRLVAELTGNDEHYAGGELVPRSDLWWSCHDNLEQVIGHLVTPPADPANAFTPAASTGRRRAEQGFPLENLLHAYRVGGRLIWQGLLEGAGTDRAPDRSAELLEAATQVWDVIDAFSSVVGNAYRLRETELRRHDEERRLMLIDGLLEGRGRDVGFAREAAAVLDLPDHGTYVVVVVRDAGDRLVRPPGAHFTAIWRMRTSAQIGIVPLTGQSLPDVARLLGECFAGPVGISPPVPGLADLGSAHRWAELAAATVSAGVGVAHLDEHLPAALLASQDGLARRLRSLVERGLRDMPEPDRVRLLETVDRYLREDRCVARTAERLYCHRNTVRNRLREFERLTGRSFDRVDDLVEIALARTAARLPTITHNARVE